MTTILADYALGIMAADSSVTDGDRVWVGRKVTRVRGALIGTAGEDAHRIRFIAWYRAGGIGKIDMGESSALILADKGLYVFDANYSVPQLIESGREAIGTGAKAAMCAYEALGWQGLRRAVQIVCKHDSGSRGPVRMYAL